MLPGIIGTQILDPVNVVVALTLYTVALMVRVVADGLALGPGGRRARRRRRWATGASAACCRWSCRSPIPVIAAGLRVAAVSNVSLVAVAALLGVPQLGQLFTVGFQLFYYIPIVAGVVLCLLLAFLLDGLILLAARLLTPWTRAARS